MLSRHYDPMQAYSQSKLALVMFTFDLAEALKGERNQIGKRGAPFISGGAPLAYEFLMRIRADKSAVCAINRHLHE
jgi:hypothetical protein